MLGWSGWLLIARGSVPETGEGSRATRDPRGPDGVALRWAFTQGKKKN